MTLTVHNLAKNYSLLPSEVLGRASTFDLYVLDTFTRYQRFIEKKNSVNAKAPISKTMTQDEMRAMIDRVKRREKLLEQKNAKIPSGPR